MAYFDVLTVDREEFSKSHEMGHLICTWVRKHQQGNQGEGYLLFRRIGCGKGPVRKQLLSTRIQSEWMDQSGCFCSLVL